jgi:hypothetical protein
MKPWVWRVSGVSREYTVGRAKLLLLSLFCLATSSRLPSRCR